MTLWKRGGIYWAYVTQDGVRRSRSTGTGNRKLAEAIGRKFEEELVAQAAGLTNLRPDMLFSELVALFLGAGEVKEYHKDRLKVLLPFWADTTLRSISRATIREYRQYRLKHKSLTESTINRDLEVLRHILYWATDEGYLAFNPLTRLRLPRPRRRKRPVLSWTEEQELVANASPHLRQLIIAALDTGMRRGELLNQRWEDVDLDRGLLSVTHSKTAEGEQRELPLTSRMRCMLSLRQQRSGLVFTFKGEEIARIKTGWKGAVRRSGIRPLRFHDLRHNHNTRLLELGIVADVRKALMGHSLGDDAHATYVHIELPLKRKAIALLDQWIAEQMQSTRGGDAHVRFGCDDRGDPEAAFPESRSAEPTRAQAAE